ncbi:hypothetical protein CBL_20141 [Carabus blaptoides fortunei]
MANGCRHFYRDYMHLHGRQNRSLQELGRATRRMWRSLSAEERRGYVLREVQRQMSMASVGSVSSASMSTTYSAHSSEYHQLQDQTPQILSAQQLQLDQGHGAEPQEPTEEPENEQCFLGHSGRGSGNKLYTYQPDSKRVL